jgi:seryl-tRNA synthetase
MRIVVADLYQLQRMNGKFTVQHKTLAHPRQKVAESYVNEINENSEENGRLYIIDEKATKENHEARENHLKALEMREQAAKITPEAILGALSNSVKKEVKETKTEKVVDEVKATVNEPITIEKPKQTLAPRRAKNPDLD